MERYLTRLRGLRWLVIAIWGLTVIGAAGVYVARFQIDNSVGIWFLDDDPELVEYRQFNQIYGETEWTFALVRTGSIYAPAFLRDLAAVVGRIEALEDVVRVVSLANVRDSEVDEEGTLRYLPILAGEGEDLTRSALAEFRRRLQGNPIFAANLYQPGDDRHTAVLIQNVNSLDEQAPYRMRLVDHVRSVFADYPSVEEVSLAGTTVINAELNRAAKRDMFVYYTLISILLVVSGWLFLTHLQDVMVLLAVVLGSVVPTMGLIGLLGLSVNMVTIMLPTILVSMSVSVVVHLINDFHHERRRLASRMALAQALRTLLRPSFWTTVTTVVGFLSLTASSVVPVQQIGMLAAFGVLLAWLQTQLIAPILLDLIWASAERESFRSVRWSRRVAHGAISVAERRPGIALFASGLLLVALVGLSHLQADTDYVDFFRADSTMRADYEKVDATDFSQYYVSIDLAYPPERTYTENPLFGQVLDLEAAIEAMPEVRKLLSASKLLREADRALTGERVTRDAFAAFGSDRLGQLALLTEASGNDDLTDLLTGDRGRSQLLLMTDYMSTQQFDTFRAQLEVLMGRYLPAAVRHKVTGTNVLWANMDASIIRTQLVSLTIVMSTVALLMLLLHGSIALGVVGLSVSFLPVLAVLGLMGWLGIKVNMATCLIGGIAIGVAVDDTIYLLDRIRHELARGRTLAYAVRCGILVAGGAMTTTSLILTGGFLTMALSDFMPSAEFGTLFAMTIILALVGDLLVLPALLVRLPQRWLWNAANVRQPS